MKDTGGRVVLEPVGDLVLVPVQGPVDTGLMGRLEEGILGYIEREGARGIVLDLEGVEVMDESDFECLRRVVACAALMGAPVVLACLRPGVAAGLTMLDVDDSWVTAVRTVEQAMTCFGQVHV